MARGNPKSLVQELDCFVRMDYIHGVMRVGKGIFGGGRRWRRAWLILFDIACLGLC